MRSVPGPSIRLSSTRTCPAVGCCSPAITCNRVDFPQPEGPTMQRNSPGFTLRSIPSSASNRDEPFALYVSERFFNVSLAVPLLPLLRTGTSPDLWGVTLPRTGLRCSENPGCEIGFEVIGRPFSLSLPEPG